jgi:nucleolar protein 6
MAVPKRGSDQSRAERKAKKRKLEDTIPDLPGDDQVVAAELASDNDEHLSKKRKRSSENGLVEGGDGKPKKKEKKRQKDGDSTTLAGGDNGSDSIPNKTKKGKKEVKHQVSVEESPADLVVAVGDTDVPKKSKKERKAERKAREAVEKATRDKDALAGESTSIAVDGSKAATIMPADPEEKRPKKNNRNREKKRKAALEDGAEVKAPRFIAFIGMSIPFELHRSWIYR